MNFFKGNNFYCRQILNLGGFGQLDSESGREISLGSIPPSTPTSGQRLCSQSWKPLEVVFLCGSKSCYTKPVLGALGGMAVLCRCALWKQTVLICGCLSDLICANCDSSSHYWGHWGTWREQRLSLLIPDPSYSIGNIFYPLHHYFCGGWKFMTGPRCIAHSVLYSWVTYWWVPHMWPCERFLAVKMKLGNN